MGEQIHVYVDIRFLNKWTWLTVVGWFLGLTVAEEVTAWVFPSAEHALLGSSPIYYAVFGAVLGFLQWWSIRDRISRSFGWVIATAGGLFLAGWLVNKQLYILEPFATFFQNFPLLVDIVIGAVLGFSQYLVVKKKLAYSYAWPLLLPVIWTISTGIMGTPNVWLQLVGMFTFGLSTAVAMEGLSRLYSHQESPPNKAGI